MRRLIARTASRLRPAERAARRRAVLRGGAVVAVVAVLGAGAWAVRAGVPGMLAARAGEAALAASAEAGLAVGSVTVSGRQRTDNAAILDALGVDRGTPTLALDPAAARERLEALPWIGRARVERRFPGTLRVELRERDPMAVHTLGGDARLIDWEGAPIAGIDPTRFPGLLRVGGRGAAEHARELLRALEAQPMLADRVERAQRVGGRRWEVHLRNGVRVALPAGEPARGWTRLAKLESAHRLLQRDIRRVDLRPAERVVLERGQPVQSGEAQRNG